MFIKEQLTLMEEILNKQLIKVYYILKILCPIIAKQLVNEVKNSNMKMFLYYN